jgi:hypothetical protein
MRKSAIVVLTLLVGACTSKDQPGPAGPGPGDRACTEIGCVNGLRIELQKATQWAAGHYTFAFDVEGTKIACMGTLPLKACDAGPSLQCEPTDRVQIGESGCALEPATHGFSDIQFLGGEPPRAVELTILKDEQPLHTVKLSPTYKKSRPNGEGCEPECNSATERVALP